MIDVRALPARLFLIVPVALALFGSWHALRWYLGNVIAEHAPSVQDGRLDTALRAVHLAPDDPLPHWTLASLERRDLPPEESQDAIRHFEQAASLSPNDYRLWLDLGRAREQAGDIPGAEKALRRAVALAPSYAETRWFLGNLLLRANRSDEAFAELRLAASAEARYRPQVFNMAWHVYGEDVEAVGRALGDSAAARSAFASYLLGLGRIDDALRQWAGLSAAEKKEQVEIGRRLISTLLELKRYHAAVELVRDIDPQVGANMARERLLNGGFEEDIGPLGGGLFGWQVQTAPQLQIALDESQKHSGRRSLRVFFNISATLTVTPLSQFVVVEPSSAYRLEFYVRTADLKSGSTPYIKVSDSANGALLGRSELLPTGMNDWQQVTIDFKTGPATEAVSVVTARDSCGEDGICPIFGMIWYDDFNLQRSGGASVSPTDKRAGQSGRAPHSAR